MFDDVPHTVTRVTEPDDKQLLAGVRHAMAMWSESPTYAALEPDLDSVIAFAYTVRADPSSYCKVALRGGEVIGFMVGSLAHLGFYDGTYAYDRMLYVTPNKRGTHTARMLIDDFHQWASDNEAAYVLLGVTTGVHTERTEKLYNKVGYRTVGVLTMKET